MDHRWSGSSVPGIFQAKILEWLAVPAPGDLPAPRTETTSFMSPALAGVFFTSTTTRETPSERE